MRHRYYYKPREGSITIADLEKTIWVPIRSYVFAFEPSGGVGSNPNELAKRMSRFSKATEDVHLHGVFIGTSAYYETIAVDPNAAKPEDFYHVRYTEDHMLASFKWSLLHSLSRFPRYPDHWTPAIDLYNENRSKWMKYP